MVRGGGAPALLPPYDAIVPCDWKPEGGPNYLPGLFL